jgi:ABC-type branched-subunit amino acid transport system substrate-binding protein
MARRKVVALVSALTACFSLAVVSTGSAAPAPLMIAVEGPQSGAQASNGLDQLRGVRLAAKQLNAHGGLWDHRKVVLFPADDKASAGDAQAVALGVIAKGIRFVIGPYNSAVGLVNLPIYRSHDVLPVWMTSRDQTAGLGVTLQPMNSQISPVNIHYVKGLGVRHIAMLVDDTANGAFTTDEAKRLRAALRRQGKSVSWTSVLEGQSGSYYTKQVAEALSTKPDFVYVSTYFPEGAKIAKALSAKGRSPRCLMGLANVDSGFLAQTTPAQAQRCVFVGVPAAPQMPSAATYVRQYRSAFGKNPGVWGSFTYDSARILFRAINAARSYDVSRIERQLRRTKGFLGATGLITINPKNGYRKNVPVSILRVDHRRRFVIAK